MIYGLLRMCASSYQLLNRKRFAPANDIIFWGLIAQSAIQKQGGLIRKANNQSVQQKDAEN